MEPIPKCLVYTLVLLSFFRHVNNITPDCIRGLETLNGLLGPCTSELCT